MYLSFDSFPAHSRIWVYQADRKLTEQESAQVSADIRTFCEGWEAHGQPLKTSFQLLHNQFLILAVDEGVHQASGCSIDGSVRVLKNLQSQGINFLDASKIAFLINEEVKLFSRLELKALFVSGFLSPQTITFNNLVATKGDWEMLWKIPVEKSWMAKYLPNHTLVQ
ncbi:MAG: hypothetical protein HYZ44_09040 [Bacteroidetes bacterium]|nr:hypothetical protein [Bacteroidota bacterium]